MLYNFFVVLIRSAILKYNTLVVVFGEFFHHMRKEFSMPKYEYVPNCQECETPCFDFEETGYCWKEHGCCPMLEPYEVRASNPEPQ